jgi:hypothetical protein
MRTQSAKKEKRTQRPSILSVFYDCCVLCVLYVLCVLWYPEVDPEQ